MSWFSLAIPVECLLYPNYSMFLSSAVTHRVVAIARVCSGMNMLELALDGLNWNMLLHQWEIMHQKNFGRVKSPLGREKPTLGREKSPAPFFSSFDGCTLPLKRM